MTRALLGITICAPLLAGPADPDAIAIGSRLELFVDRALVEELSGDARRQLHEPVTGACPRRSTTSTPR